MTVSPSAGDVVVQPDLRLPAGAVTLGLGLIGLHQYGPGVPLAVIGGLLALQATRVRFLFDDEAMEVKIGEELDESGENFAVGGANRWKYNTWTNWEVYPNESLPILMYFKETQTSPEGQIHFFPFIMDPEILLREVRARVPQVKK
ncbi:unnamed protein product [Chrysoparadoxa australica]